MGAGLTILISIFFLIFLGLIVVLAYYLVREEEEKEEKPHFMSFIRQTNGKAYGKVLEIEKAVEGKSIVHFKPQDLSLKTLKKMKKIEPTKAIIDKGKLHCFPKGTLSNDKDIYWGLPNNADDFPESFQETSLGKCLMYFTELQNVNNTVLKVLRERVERQAALVKKTGGGEATIEEIQRIEGLHLDALKGITEVQKVKTSSGFSSIGQNIPK